MPVTEVISSTNEITAATVEALKNTLLTGEAAVPWHVIEFKGTSHDRLFELDPGAISKAEGKPLVVVCYSGSTYANFPRRSAKIIVLVFVEGCDVDATGTAVHTMADRVMTVLDERIDGNIKWEIEADDAVDFGPNLACQSLRFSARDH